MVSEVSWIDNANISADREERNNTQKTTDKIGFFLTTFVLLSNLCLSHLNAVVTVESDYADHTVSHVQKGRNLLVRVLRDSSPCNHATATKRRRSINERSSKQPNNLTHRPIFFRSTNNRKLEYTYVVLQTQTHAMDSPIFSVATSTSNSTMLRTRLSWWWKFSSPRCSHRRSQTQRGGSSPGGPRRYDTA